MRYRHMPIASLTLTAFLLACYAGDGPTGTNGFPTGNAPDTGPMQAAVQVEHVHLDDFLFLVNDETGLTATVGLASPVADLPECGGRVRQSWTVVALTRRYSRQPDP